MTHERIIKALAALIPVLLGALVTLAWQNSHKLVVITNDLEHVEDEVAHLRGLVEQRLAPPR